jgi:hypothetical protein
MGRIVIVAYKPKPGQEQGLVATVEKHLRVLREENLVTDKPAHVMRASDGTILEVFEWLSSEAIARAHANGAVQALWGEFEEVCDYVPLASLSEAQQMFAEFEAVSCSRESWRLEDGFSLFALTQDHERWVKSACRKYGRSREYWRDLIRRQRGTCAFSGAPLFFDATSGTPVKGGPSQHPLYAVVDHCAPGSDAYGHEIVCNDLNDIKGHLPYDCFQALRRAKAWQQFILRWRQQAERNPDRAALRALRRDECKPIGNAVA